MSDECESVDNDDAENVLRQEWKRILNDDEHDYLCEETIARKITEVLNDSQLTYKYILCTNVLAKAVNPRIHYRAMQAQSDLPGAYNARSLGHQVLVEWEKDHGERLGGSNEPFLNKPARFPEFAMENAHRSASAHRRLYELLDRLEGKTGSGEVDPMDVLRHTLYEISLLKPRTVEADHANVPDEFSNAAGDVEVFRNGELVRALEVKDKPTERSDVQHAVTKARGNELGEYLYVVGAGFRTETEKHGSMAETENAPIEVIFVYPDDLLGLLKFVGDAGRISFTESVGEFLNAMRASDENKGRWKDIVEDFGADNS